MKLSELAFFLNNQQVCVPSSETIIKKKQKVPCTCVNLTNAFIDDNDKNSENGNFIFLGLFMEHCI